jgi:hypothetical protein
MYALVIGYFFLAFLIYAISDFVAWRRSEVIQYERYLYAKINNPDKDLEETKRYTSAVVAESGNPMMTYVVPRKERITYRGLASWSAGIFASRIRAIFDFLLPPVFAMYVLLTLISYATR